MLIPWSQKEECGPSRYRGHLGYQEIKRLVVLRGRYF